MAMLVQEFTHHPEEEWQPLLVALTYKEIPLPKTLGEYLFISHLCKLGHILTSKNISEDQGNLFVSKLVYSSKNGEGAMPK